MCQLVSHNVHSAASISSVSSSSESGTAESSLLETMSVANSVQHAYDTIIVGAGSIAPSDELTFHALLDDAGNANNNDATRTMIIAADGGVDTLKSWGITPHYIIGDFDSAQQQRQYQAQHNEHTVVLPTHKDETDMHEAVTLAWGHGARRIALFGALGGRIDHTFANLQLIAALAAAGGNGMLCYGSQAITVLSQGSLHFPMWQGGNGAMVSLLAHSDIAHQVDIQGLLYEAQLDVMNTHAQAVSNEFVLGKAAHISVAEGSLTVTWDFGDVLQAQALAPSQTSREALAAILTPHWHTSLTRNAQAFGSVSTQTSAYYQG